MNRMVFHTYRNPRVTRRSVRLYGALSMWRKCSIMLTAHGSVVELFFTTYTTCSTHSCVLFAILSQFLLTVFEVVLRHHSWQYCYEVTHFVAKVLPNWHWYYVVIHHVLMHKLKDLKQLESY